MERSMTDGVGLVWGAHTGLVLLSSVSSL
jgi:hypothetical protein